MMMVPGKRRAYVRDECLRRLASAGLSATTTETGWTVQIDGTGRRLSIATWDDVLGFLLDATNHPDSAAAREDLKQIRGLITEVQDRLFVPFSSLDLTEGAVPRGARQTLQTFHDLRPELKSRGWEQPSKYAAEGNGTHRFDIHRPGHALTWIVYMSFPAWETNAPTPFYVAIDWAQRAEYNRLLAPLARRVPPKAFEFNWSTPGFGIALDALVDADRAAVIAHLADQIDDWTDRFQLSLP